MLKKLWADEKKRDFIMLVAMSLIFTLTLFLGSSARGFLSTIPLFFVSAVIVFLFYRNLRRSLLMTALMSLVVSLADSTGYNSVAEQAPSANYAFIKVLFFLISALMAYAVAGFIRKKSRSGIVKAVLMCVLYFALFVIMFGNIFSAVKWHNNTADYLKENYPEQQIESMSTSYNFKTHYYETIITFKEPERSYYGEEKMVLQDNYDGYFLYAKNAVFEMGASLIKSCIAKVDSQLITDISALPFEQTLERKMFDLGADYSAVFPYLSYEIVIKEDCPTLESFNERCLLITDALKDSFPYTRIKFYGGEKGGYLFEGEIKDGVFTSGDFDEAEYTDTHR